MKRLTIRVTPLALAAFALSAMPAHAQTTGGGGSLTTFINNIANLATGTLGQALAILAVALCGIATMFGGLDRRSFGHVVLGIALVFSAAWVVGQITGNSTGTSGF